MHRKWRAIARSYRLESWTPSELLRRIADRNFTRLFFPWRSRECWVNDTLPEPAIKSLKREASKMEWWWETRWLHSRRSARGCDSLTRRAALKELQLMRGISKLICFSVLGRARATRKPLRVETLPAGWARGEMNSWLRTSRVEFYRRNSAQELVVPRWRDKLPNVNFAVHYYYTRRTNMYVSAVFLKYRFGPRSLLVSANCVECSGCRTFATRQCNFPNNFETILVRLNQRNYASLCGRPEEFHFFWSGPAHGLPPLILVYFFRRKGREKFV